MRNRDVPTWEANWALHERFRLGSLDEDGPEIFGQIGGIELGSAGEVYVLDSQASEIRLFDSDGTFQRVVGGQGEGPGELSSPGGLALDSDGTLWVMNWGNGRYTGFDPATGELRREARRHIFSASFPWPGAFESGRLLLDEGQDRNGQKSVIRLDTAFVPRDTMPLPESKAEDRIWFRSGSTKFAALMEPFAPQPAWAPRPNGGIVVGEGSEYRLHRIGFDRDTAMTIEMERARARVTDAERDSALSFFQEMEESLGGLLPDRRPRSRNSKPAHGSLFVDDQDRTWVRSVPPSGVGPTWDVFGADGRFLGQVAIPDPPGFLRPIVRADRMIVATQVDGVPTVIVYDLVRVIR